MTFSNLAAPKTLSTAPFEHPAMDFNFLRQEGIRYLEQMGGRLWTDFNTHDPGITILEQVCYAITDLAHRISYDLPDLLAKDGEPTYASMYSPAEILTSYPVTLEDLRKLVIDVEGVKNAWVEKLETPEFSLYYQAGDGVLTLDGDPSVDQAVTLKGLYRVLIENSDLVYLDGNAAQQDAILQQVKLRLHANRGLCEDFTEIAQLPPQNIQIKARIEIDAVEDVEGLMVAIYQTIAEYISPSVHFHSLRELLDQGKRVDEIFDGPLLDHGFIDTDELRSAQRRSVLRASDLIGRIMDVPGVRAVRTIAMSKGVKYEDWSLELDSQSTATQQAQAPKFDAANSSIILERKQLPAQIDNERVLDLYNQVLRGLSAEPLFLDNERDLQPPPGQDRYVGSYYSFQHQFPVVYGVGAAGLPEWATPERKAQAKQLKAYLLFFDQLLANYFAQLAHVRDLFSFSADSQQSYFSQVIDDPSLGLAEIYVADPETYAARLQALTENPYGETDASRDWENIVRRNRFLNHLLARFAEQFTDYSLVLYGAISSDDDDRAAELAELKQRFLQEYPQISAGRGTGFNYLMQWSSENRSGLEKRIERKLGINREEDRFYVIEHILLRPMEGDEQQLVPLLADPQLKDPYSLQISFVFPLALLNSRHLGFQEFVERTVREETPAHLVPAVYWLDETAIAPVAASYDEWVEKRRIFWQEKVGV